MLLYQVRNVIHAARKRKPFGKSREPPGQLSRLHDLCAASTTTTVPSISQRCVSGGSGFTQPASQVRGFTAALLCVAAALLTPRSALVNRPTCTRSPIDIHNFKTCRFVFTLRAKLSGAVYNVIGPLCDSGVCNGRAGGRCPNLTIQPARAVFVSL